MDACQKSVSSQKKNSSVKTNNGQIGNHYVKVFYIISSLHDINEEHLKISNTTLFLRRLQELKDITKQGIAPTYWEFATDGIFHNCRQDDIYNEVVQDIVERLATGNNGILVAFGQTGSGKSTTMAGLEFVSNENYGIAVRVIKRLLEIKRQFHGNKRVTLEMSYIEMSNNAVYDLFKKYPNSINPWNINKEAAKFKITTETEALKELFLGEARKETKATRNYLSHINTSLLTFYVTVRDSSFNNGFAVQGRLHLIDMAGSDTVGNLTCVFKTNIEVGAANLAKTSLEQFFLCLVEKSQTAIRSMQRINPLIYFLKDDLNTNSTLRFIGHISSAKEDLPISRSMMRFGQVVRGYKPSVIQINKPEKMTPENKIRYLKQKFQELEDERIQNSILLNEDLTSNMNSERVEHLQKIIKDYLHNHISEVELMRVTDVSMAFKLFKDLHSQWEHERQRLSKEGSLSFGKRISESELSLPKKKGSARSSSTLNTSKTFKEKRRHKKSRDASADDKRSMLGKSDKQISVQSFLESQLKSQTIRSTNSQDRSSAGSIAQANKRRKSRLIPPMQKRASEVKQRSASSFTGFIPDTVVTLDSVPNPVDAWNAFSKETFYITFMEEYKTNERNMNMTYGRYLDALKLLHDQKVNIDAMKQEIIETKLLMKFKLTDNNEYTNKILKDAETNCKEKKEMMEKDNVHQKEIVLRYLAELRAYLDQRRNLKEELTSQFDKFCKDQFSFLIPAGKSLSLTDIVKESLDSIQVHEFHDENENLLEKISEEVQTSEIQIYQFQKIMKKERNQVVKMRAINNKKIFDKKCYP